MRREKFSTWLVSLALTLVSTSVTALPILGDADGNALRNYALEQERACGVRNFCLDVRYTPDMPHFTTFELPTLEKPPFVPLLPDQPISFVDDIVLVNDVTRVGTKERPVSVPEPGTLFLLAAGLFGFTLRRLGSS